MVDQYESSLRRIGDKLGDSTWSDTQLLQKDTAAYSIYTAHCFTTHLHLFWLLISLETLQG